MVWICLGWPVCVLCMKVESPTGKSTVKSSSVIRYADDTQWGCN
jgi:hypothetical protein